MAITLVYKIPKSSGIYEVHGTHTDSGTFLRERFEGRDDLDGFESSGVPGETPEVENFTSAQPLAKKVILGNKRVALYVTNSTALEKARAYSSTLPVFILALYNRSAKEDQNA
ncbi:hypothetical protein RJ640_015636 [Escallonia rubra]|uniref:Uncharacterized protein n=1 Tax=Escallonia rubra TaxID=112253 RepID=A0AA88QZN9_9ASTE|nr:hypothetical protein RJ640_015636 [Escallonia rubra]